MRGELVAPVAHQLSAVVEVALHGSHHHPIDLRIVHADVPAHGGELDRARLEAAHRDVAAHRRCIHRIVRDGIHDLDVAGDALERLELPGAGDNDAARHRVGAQLTFDIAGPYRPRHGLYGHARVLGY